MAKKKPNSVTIDLNVWTTQAAKAKADGVKISTLAVWVMRGKIESWKIPELGITLVKK